MKINDRLRAAREAAGYASASDAAKRFEWPIPTYLSHENDSRGLRLDVIERYAAAFGVNKSWLAFGFEPMNADAQRAETCERVQ